MICINSIRYHDYTHNILKLYSFTVVVFKFTEIPVLYILQQILETNVKNLINAFFTIFWEENIKINEIINVKT